MLPAVQGDGRAVQRRPVVVALAEPAEGAGRAVHGAPVGDEVPRLGGGGARPAARVRSEVPVRPDLREPRRRVPDGERPGPEHRRRGADHQHPAPPVVLAIRDRGVPRPRGLRLREHRDPDHRASRCSAGWTTNSPSRSPPRSPTDRCSTSAWTRSRPTGPPSSATTGRSGSQAIEAPAQQPRGHRCRDSASRWLEAHRSGASGPSPCGIATSKERLARHPASVTNAASGRHSPVPRSHQLEVASANP